MQSTKQIVQRLIKRHGTNDPTTIARKMGILILFEDFKNIWGYFNMSKRVPMIHVNRNLDEHLQRFVIAHELGHSIQHPSADLKAVNSIPEKAPCEFRPQFPRPDKTKTPDLSRVFTLYYYGAGDGNRTHAASLGSWSSAIEPHPHN